MHTSTDQSLDSEDFQEAPSIARTKGYSPIAVGIFGAISGLILAVVLIQGSLPEMTPEQIVAMDGYEGQQPPRYIFNLDSLGSGIRDVDSVQASITPESDPAAVTNSAPQLQTASVAPGVNRTTADALLAIKTEEPTDSWPLEIVEVPASPLIVGKDALEVAAPVVEEFDYRKLNRRTGNAVKTSDETLVASVSAKADKQDNPAAKIAAATIKVLPVLTVNTDNAYVRAEPSQSADVKLVLAKGMSVTAFEKAGAWVYVGANDGSSITGYVHQSSIAVTELN